LGRSSRPPVFRLLLGGGGGGPLAIEFGRVSYVEENFRTWGRWRGRGGTQSAHIVAKGAVAKGRGVSV